MENFISKVLSFMSNLPKWLQILVTALFALLVSIGIFFSIPSCSSVRAVSYGDGKLSTTVSQSVGDSLNIVVHFNK